MKKAIAAIMLLCGISAGVEFNSPVEEQARSAEFSANTSTAFSLLDMSPATINTFGSAKEIKVDWFMKDRKIVDNIAVEILPIWMIFFRNVNMQEYRELPYIVRKLGDIKFSMGNKKALTNHNFGVAVNFNLFSQAEPSMDTNLLAQIKAIVSEKERKLFRESMRLEMALEMAPIAEKSSIQSRIDAIDDELSILSEKEQARLKRVVEDYKRKNWNKAFVNIGAGNVTSYYLSDDYSKFELFGNTWIFWLHYGFPIKEHMQLLMLNRYYTSRQMCNGLNLRVGGSDERNVFTEFLAYTDFTKKGLTTYVIGVGGSVKFKKKYFISLGFKFGFSDKFKLKEITPSYNLNLGF